MTNSNYTHQIYFENARPIAFFFPQKWLWLGTFVLLYVVSGAIILALTACLYNLDGKLQMKMASQKIRSGTLYLKYIYMEAALQLQCNHEERE